MKFIESKYTSFILLLSMIAIVFVMGNSIQGQKSTIKFLEHERSLIEKENIKLDSLNTVLETSNTTLSDSVVLLQHDLDSLEISKKDIVKYYEKKLKAIDGLNATELEQFFSERYQSR